MSSICNSKATTEQEKYILIVQTFLYPLRLKISVFQFNKLLKRVLNFQHKNPFFFLDFINEKPFKNHFFSCFVFSLTFKARFIALKKKNPNEK